MAYSTLDEFSKELREISARLRYAFEKHGIEGAPIIVAPVAARQIIVHFHPEARGVLYDYGAENAKAEGVRYIANSDCDAVVLEQFRKAFRDV